MHINKCTSPRAHSEVHIPKCPFPSVHSQVHIPQVHIPQVHIRKCTFPSAHSLSAHSPVHIPHCTFPSGHSQKHIPKCTFPKCTVTQNRCEDRTGGLTPLSPTGGGSHEKKKQIRLQRRRKEKRRRKWVTRKTCDQGELADSQIPILTKIHPSGAHTLKGPTTQRYQNTNVPTYKSRTHSQQQTPKMGLAPNGDKGCLTEAPCRSKARKDTSPKGAVDQTFSTFTATPRVNYPTRSG